MAICAMIAFIVSKKWKKMQHNIKASIEKRSPIDDNAFAYMCSAKDEKSKKIAISCRKSIADTCEVDSKLIYPDDKLSGDIRLLWKGDYDPLALILKIESETGMKITYDMVRKNDLSNINVQVADYIQKVLASMQTIGE
jgi:hypothetical protein